ncbi:unnamed protein product [Symbiodinium sp. CCMP2592]|nr:unnamed protein product [Symbiodinium sp. CCMP2592]
MQEPESCSALQVTTRAPMRTAIFMTTHWSKQHQSFLPCWETAVQQLPLLQNADLILYTSANLSNADMEPLRFRNFFVKHYKNPGYQQGAMQAVIHGFGPKGHMEKWFAGYDWVVRLNPDVLILQDQWLRETMENASVDGIFGECKGGLIQTDFFAVRPQAVDYTRMDMCQQWPYAETHFRCVVHNILKSRRYTLVKGGQSAECHIVGGNSPIVHNHAFLKCCPDYLAKAKAGKCPTSSGKPFNESAASEDLPPFMRDLARKRNITLYTNNAPADVEFAEESSSNAETL